MKKYMDKLRSNIRINKNLFVFLVVIIAVGVASGSIFVTVLNDSDKTMVSDYLNNFFNNLNSNNLNYSGTLINTLIFTLGLVILIWILGISVIGFILILLFLFIKAFALGFSVGSIIINFNFKGILIALAYVVPHHIINLMIYLLISSYALVLSYRLINSFTKKKSFDFKGIFNRYLFILGFSLIILLFSALYEVYLAPSLINMIVNILT
ncbi:stage II sporulation protein M [Firmicutes bacterium CAG:822]|nr:stage II sporulation protein M [Firmicutes bacterium CAG:822]